MTDPLLNDPDPTMTDLGAHHAGSQADVAARRPGVDLLALAAGLGALSVAGGVLLDVDIRWVLAALAILVGLLLVIGTVRPRRH